LAKPYAYIKKSRVFHSRIFHSRVFSAPYNLLRLMELHTQGGPNSDTLLALEFPLALDAYIIIICLTLSLALDWSVPLYVDPA